MPAIETPPISSYEVQLEYPQLAIIDFDRVIFKTEDFYTDFCATAEQYCGVDPAELTEAHQSTRLDAGQPFDGIEALLTVSTRKLMQPIDKAALKSFLRQQLAGGDYLHQDAADLLARLRRRQVPIAVATVGTDQFQGLKRDTLPAHITAGLDWRISHGSKADTVQQLLRDYVVTYAEQAFVVDDRADTFDDELLATGVICIRLNRPGSKYGAAKSPATVQTVTSAQQVRIL